MPVSYLPCLTPILLIGIPFLLLFRSRRSAGIAAIISASLVAVLLLTVFVPGWILEAKASSGDGESQYRYAQWRENHSEQVGAIILWPASPDVLGGYQWLEEAAKNDYPPAVWLVGQRLKHGIHVPRPSGWQGPAGNVFPQPDRGQDMIDRAIDELGFQPPMDGPEYYWQHYRAGRNL